MLTLTGVAALVVVSVLFLILGYLLWNGGKSLNWAFFTQLPKPVGESGGGMANAIIGSLKLLLLAAVIGLPIGLLAGVYLAEFGGKTFSFVIRYTTDILNGVPSMVIGIFAYARGGSAGQAFFNIRGRGRLGSDGDSHHRPKHRRVPARRSGKPPRGCHGSRREQMADDCNRGVACGSRAVLLLACSWLWRASPARLPRFCSQLSTTSIWSPGWGQPTASLPVVIYTYALSAVRRLAPASVGCGARVAGTGSRCKCWHAAGSEPRGSRSRCLTWPPPHKARNTSPQSSRPKCG